MPSECKECGNKDNYNFALDIGLCNPCISEKLERLEDDVERLKELLQRHKESMEPFPVVSDLRSMTQRLREKHSETDVKVIKAAYRKHKAKFRKLYKDTKQFLEKRII